MPSEPTQTERVAPSLWRIPLQTPTLPPATKTNAFVWLTQSGAWVVDPGSPRRAEVKRLERFLMDRAAERRVVGYILTHHHRDHWGGLSLMLARLPAPVVVHDPGRYAGLRAQLVGPDWFAARAEDAAVIHTPGHASDHIVLWLNGGDILAGDLVAGVGTVVINPPDGNMADYLASLQGLLERGPARLFPAHGPTIENGTAKLQEYLAHRRHREEQVVRALRQRAPARPRHLVREIYPDLPRLLRPLAARSVLAHLIKLEQEARATRVGGKWSLIE